MSRFSAAAIFVSLVLIVAASAPVFAAKPCDDYPHGNPKEALRVLDEVEAFVPFGPPEESAYFEPAFAGWRNNLRCMADDSAMTLSVLS